MIVLNLARNLAGRFPLDHVPDKLRPLNVAHNKAIRAIMCAKRYDKETKTITHTAPLLKHLKLLSLNDIYYLNLALFAYDCLLTNDLPEIFSNYIENVDNPYNSRSCANNAAIPQVRLDATYGSIKGSVWSKKSFPFFAENMIIRSILNLWWHSEILKLILGVVRGIFTKRLKRTRRLLYTVKYDFFQMTALHSKC